MSKVLDKYLKLVGLLPRGDSGGGGGGGGSSDFATATITFTLDSEIATDLPIFGAFVDPDGNGTSPVVMDPTGPIDVVLHKGYAFIMPMPGLDFTATSGDIEFDLGYGMWHIWGDCAITYASGGGMT